MPSQPPTGPHLINRLRQLSLQSPPATAAFYARIWYALFPPGLTGDHESLHTLALCLLQAGQPYSGLHLVRDTAEGRGRESDEISPIGGCYGCALIVAKCCEKLGRFSEGQAVLNRAMRISGPSSGLAAGSGLLRGLSTGIPTPSPASTSASAHMLLASLSHKGKAPEHAVEQYTKALQEDPWLWEAFTGLCDIGSPPSTESLFRDPMPQANASSRSRPPTLSPNPLPRGLVPDPPFLTTKRNMSHLSGGTGGGGFFTPDVAGPAVAGIPKKLGLMGNPGTWETPLGAADTTFEQAVPAPSRRPFPTFASMIPAPLRAMATPSSGAEAAPSKPPAMKRPRGTQSKKAAETPNQNGHANGKDLMVIDPHEHEASVRRSRRLNTAGMPKQPPPIKVARDKRSQRSKSVTSSASGATIEMPSPPAQASDQQLQQAADDWLRGIVRRCAKVYRALSLYQCMEVIQELDGLPEELQHSVWGLDILARAMFEMANYTAARRVYDRLLQLDPYRLEGMEHFSTLLWHLGDSPALSHLSQSLVAIDRESPQAWIAAGNCFSLQKDQDEAMRCFRRATQVAPSFAYAWTLCGYEAIEMEEYERAIAFFRTAIRTETRHYNAWYGMGLVYLKTGKAKYAEHHFRRATEINPTNPVLLCCIGMVLEELDDTMQALSFYDQAIRFSPHSPMIVFKRIRALVSLGRVEDAIPELEQLTRTAPDEANIFFLLGKCYLRLDRKSEAMVVFSHARDLQPKLEAAIKATFEAGGEDEEEDGE